MDVTFRRTGERRYGVFVQRDFAPPLMMHPAPGYDPFLPHDIVHFVAEAEWRIPDGIFGQLAAGGNAGTFWFVEQGVPNKWSHRGRRLYARRGTGMSRSEKLADLLYGAWRVRKRSLAPPADWSVRLTAAGVEDPDQVARIVERLDSIADRWHDLRVGEELTLPWPLPERSRTRRGRRRAAGSAR